MTPFGGGQHAPQPHWKHCRMNTNYIRFFVLSGRLFCADSMLLSHVKKLHSTNRIIFDLSLFHFRLFFLFQDAFFWRTTCFSTTVKQYRTNRNYIRFIFLGCFLCYNPNPLSLMVVSVSISGRLFLRTTCFSTTVKQYRTNRNDIRFLFLGCFLCYNPNPLSLIVVSVFIPGRLFCGQHASQLRRPRRKRKGAARCVPGEF